MRSEDLFNVPIFFIVFREMIEAGIIISVLLSFVEQLMRSGRISPKETVAEAVDPEHDEVHNARVKRIVRRMRIQIWAGTLVGFFIALCIGAAFIAVFYTTLNDIWSQAEQIWEGVFCLIAAIMIWFMGIAFLKMDRSRIKWRYKLAAAFDHSSKKVMNEAGEDMRTGDRPSWGSRWALFLLPLVTLLREGLEAVVFVGGVSLNTKATAIPIPVVVGIICGLIVGYIIYRTGSSTTLHWFLIVSTAFLLLIGAGLFSRGIGFLQYYRFAKGVGGDVAETGDGPGSFQVAGNVWHLTYGNPETGSATTNGGWQIFNALFGWNNTATLGSILGWVFYWISIMIALIFYKWQEGRFTFFGLSKSAAYHRRMEFRANRDAAATDAAVEEKAYEHSASSATQSAEHASGAEKEKIPTVA